jgi:hypothetical protein
VGHQPVPVLVNQAEQAVLKRASRERHRAWVTHKATGRRSGLCRGCVGGVNVNVFSLGLSNASGGGGQMKQGPAGMCVWGRGGG